MEGIGGSLNNMDTIVLDHEAKITLAPLHPLRKNNFVVRQMLEGLFMCYSNMKALETRFASAEFKGGTQNKTVMNVGTTPEIEQINNQAVNIFNWYALGILNYANYCGLVAFITKNRIRIDDLDSGETKEALNNCRKKYVSSIPELASVKVYRDKVAAHLAISNPLKNDNIGTLMQSNTNLPIWSMGRLVIGGLSYAYGPNVSAIGQNPWSVTKNFESLTPRYFRKYFVLPPYAHYQDES